MTGQEAVPVPRGQVPFLASPLGHAIRTTTFLVILLGAVGSFNPSSFLDWARLFSVPFALVLLVRRRGPPFDLQDSLVIYFLVMTVQAAAQLVGELTGAGTFDWITAVWLAVAVALLVYIRVLKRRVFPFPGAA